MANQYDTNLKLQAIADAIGNSSSSGLIQALEDIADAVAGGGGGGSSTAGLVSDNFSETDTYDLGDYCIHNNTLYVCINAITTPGAWDLSDWQATNAGIQLSSLNSALTNMGKYSTTEEVEIGTYNGSKLYRKVYSSTGTGARAVPFSGFNKNKIVKMTATLIYGVFASEPYYAAANDWWNYYVNDNNGSINLRGAGSAMNENSTFIVIIEYTK